MTQLVTPELIAGINKVYREHDVAGIVSCFAEDGMFVNGKGKELSGDIYSGKAAISRFFTELFLLVPDVQWNHIAPCRIVDNFAVTQWHRTGTTKEGVRQEWLGCDLYEFEGTLIKKKDTYVKIVL